LVKTKLEQSKETQHAKINKKICLCKI